MLSVLSRVRCHTFNSICKIANPNRIQFFAQVRPFSLALSKTEFPFSQKRINLVPTFTKTYCFAARALHNPGHNPDKKIDTKGKDGNTELHAAIKKSHSSKYISVSWLLEAGANPNIPDDNGCYPLTTAKSQGDKDLIELLESYGAVENK